MNIYLDKIKNISQKLEEKFPNKKITIMEVCGGHTNTIMKYGIRDILPRNIKLISGPGCPVCVTSQKDIDNMIELANNKIKVASYGDMIHVPGSIMSLDEAKRNGADVQLIISADEMLKEENKGRVFFGIGFETTTPMTAYLLENNICVYSAHKTMPEPMRLLMNETKIDGFIDPGHVSAIIGEEFWKELKVPQVICGFKKEQIIRAIYLLLELILEEKKDLINDYKEIVKKEGNILAKNLIKKNLKISDSEWRGMGIIKNSGLEPINDNLNAKIKYKNILNKTKSIENKTCRCGEILKGLCEPQDCPLFAKICTPENPKGACMVSETEGACGIAYKFKKI